MRGSSYLKLIINRSDRRIALALFYPAIRVLFRFLESKYSFRESSVNTVVK